MATVTVIMPTYNRAHTIIPAINSVLRQTYREFELIVVDDASSDATPQILTDFVVQDARVSVITRTSNSRTERPETEPRNDALLRARGRYIAYLDSDNLWCPPFLETMVLAIEKDPTAQLVFCNSINHYSESERSEVVNRDARRLLYSGIDWTVYGNGMQLNPDEFGLTQYIDANEMLHRSDVFSSIGAGWALRHPRHEAIMRAQGYIRPHRRFNDLELAERIVRSFGVGAAQHVPIELVHFFYPSSSRNRNEICRYPDRCPGAKEYANT